MAYKPALGNFPLCCGIVIPHTFYKNNPRTAQDLGYGNSTDAERAAARYNLNGEFNETSDEAWVKRIREFLEQWCKEYQGKKSYFLLTLNAKEAEVLEPLMLDLGFEILVPDTHNPTGTSFTLYIYHLLSKNEVKSILEIRKR